MFICLISDSRIDAADLFYDTEKNNISRERYPEKRRGKTNDPTSKEKWIAGRKEIDIPFLDILKYCCYLC